MPPSPGSSALIFGQGARQRCKTSCSFHGKALLSEGALTAPVIALMFLPCCSFGVQPFVVQLPLSCAISAALPALCEPVPRQEQQWWLMSGCHTQPTQPRRAWVCAGSVLHQLLFHPDILFSGNEDLRGHFAEVCAASSPHLGESERELRQFLTSEMISHLPQSTAVKIYEYRIFLSNFFFLRFKCCPLAVDAAPSPCPAKAR